MRKKFLRPANFRGKRLKFPNKHIESRDDWSSPFIRLTTSYIAAVSSQLKTDTTHSFVARSVLSASLILLDIWGLYKDHNAASTKRAIWSKSASQERIRKCFCSLWYSTMMKFVLGWTEKKKFCKIIGQTKGLRWIWMGEKRSNQCILSFPSFNLLSRLSRVGQRSSIMYHHTSQSLSRQNQAMRKHRMMELVRLFPYKLSDMHGKLFYCILFFIFYW